MCKLTLILRYGEAPTSSQVEEFKRVCSHFFEQHPGEIIGTKIAAGIQGSRSQNYYLTQEFIAHMDTIGLGS